MEPRALAATAATTVAIVSTIAALLAHAPGPAIASTTSYANKADEAMSAIAAGPLRQPWHPGASLLAESRPQLVAADLGF